MAQNDAAFVLEVRKRFYSEFPWQPGTIKWHTETGVTLVLLLLCVQAWIYTRAN